MALRRHGAGVAKRTCDRVETRPPGVLGAPELKLQASTMDAVILEYMYSWIEMPRAPRVCRATQTTIRPATQTWLMTYIRSALVVAPREVTRR